MGRRGRSKELGRAAPTDRLGRRSAEAPPPSKKVFIKTKKTLEIVLGRG
jgi:hypothetical protein